MSPVPRSPLDGVDRVVIDGTNLLHRLGRDGIAPPAAAIGRVRAVIPADVSIELVFDGVGHGVAGRVAQGMRVRYSGRRPADDTILELSHAATREAGGTPAAGDRILVVTDDRELRGRLLAVGVRTVPLAWLTARLDLPKLASAAPGNRRPSGGIGQPAGGIGQPARAGHLEPREPGQERPGWKPGRGATAKTGPAHRVARHRRHPRHGA